LVDVPLIVKTHGKVRWDKRKGKESATYFETLQNFQSNSLVECTPVTGRKHQIRVHLNALSCSIVADTMYGGQPIYLSEIKRKYKLGNKEEPQMISRMALHAKQISFLGNDNSLKTIESDYTKDFNILLKQLNKYASI